MAKLPHKFTLKKRKSASARVREAAVALVSLGYLYHVDGNTIWVETSAFAFLFDQRRLSKNKIYEFHAWYRSHAITREGIRTSPIGITAYEKIKRDWSAFSGANLRPLAPDRP